MQLRFAIVVLCECMRLSSNFCVWGLYMCDLRIGRGMGRHTYIRCIGHWHTHHIFPVNVGLPDMKIEFRKLQETTGIVRKLSIFQKIFLKPKTFVF